MVMMNTRRPRSIRIRSAERSANAVIAATAAATNSVAGLQQWNPTIHPRCNSCHPTISRVGLGGGPIVL